MSDKLTRLSTTSLCVTRKSWRRTGEDFWGFAWWWNAELSRHKEVFREWNRVENKGEICHCCLVEISRDSLLILWWFWRISYRVSWIKTCEIWKEANKLETFALTRMIYDKYGLHKLWTKDWRINLGFFNYVFHRISVILPQFSLNISALARVRNFWREN